MRALVIIFVLASGQLAAAQSDTAVIRVLLKTLTKTNGYRNHSNFNLLNQIGDYIFDYFTQYADTTYFQKYAVNGRMYKNVMGSFGKDNSRTVIVGAHYDVCGDQEGADDNASGVVGLLELARLLANQKPNYHVVLVAFTLEEPPFFRSQHMGSYTHAKSLVDSRIDVYGMISLEMISYFKDERKTQKYPIGLLSLFYGSRGNYITLVNKSGKGKFARKFSNQFKRSATIRTKKFSGPQKLPGIDFSDHLNYWNFGFSALMITDTAFYRNKNYHEMTDTMDTLDIARMARVIDSVFKALVSLK